jgi:hypothetical protein
MSKFENGDRVIAVTQYFPGVVGGVTPRMLD